MDPLISRRQMRS